MVLRAVAKTAEEEVDGPEDSVVTEMTKELPQEKIFEISKFFQHRFMGQEDAHGSLGLFKLVCLSQPDAEPKKGTHTLQGRRAHIGDVEVVREVRGAAAGKKKKSLKGGSS